MNALQRFAYERPCMNFGELPPGHFRQFPREGNRSWAVALSVNR